ncbi:membrane protein, putative, partial [Listeria monocytogenes FSL F2-208]
DMIGVVFGIPLLLVITLIPTFFLFKANLFVRGKVIEKYAEEFRKTANFTENEWYGEK